MPFEDGTVQVKIKKDRLTSSRAFLQELLYDLSLGVVAVVFSHRGAELTELPEEAVLVLGVTELLGEGAALGGG